MRLKVDSFLPFEVVFNPNWWYHTAGISFDKPFYFDAKTRESNDVLMRRVLFEKYGKFGLGEENPKPRPVIGSEHVAGGFVIPAMMGAEIRFSDHEAPQPVNKSMDAAAIETWKHPNFEETWPMTELIESWNQQEKEYGYLCGDLDTDGVLNTAYLFYGPDLFTDMLENPEVPTQFMREIGALIVETANYICKRAGSYAISLNRAACHLSPAPFIHANCSVQMISPRLYEKVHLPIEMEMAGQISPFGIHHCGVHMERYAKAYSKLNASFFDVGWESDPQKCRELLPDAFLNLRLNPVRMLRETAQEAAADAEYLLSSVGPLDNVGICCINMDYGTPEENIAAVYEVIEKYRHDSTKGMTHG